MRRELFEATYRKYWDIVEAQDTPRYQFSSFELCDLVGDLNWRIPIAGFMVEGELRDSINELNVWSKYLADLGIWLDLLNEYEDKEDPDAWNLRLHFVVPLVRYCMQQPSSTRDRFGRVATNGIHQANLCLDQDYKDILEQDSSTSRGFLSRKKVEAQLARLSKPWKAADRLLKALRSIDSENHRKKTIDYRNAASHFIAPRLDVGEVQIVTREVLPFKEIVKQPDGTIQFVEISGRTSVSYSFGGIRPLTLAEIIEVNSQEYDFAVEALSAYSDLLREAMPQMANKL